MDDRERGFDACREKWSFGGFAVDSDQPGRAHAGAAVRGGPRTERDEPDADQFGHTGRAETATDRKRHTEGRAKSATADRVANREASDAAELKPSERVIAFIERLRTPSGKAASRPLKLRKWQKELIRDVYDRRDANGLREVRRVLWSMAKKNGKTALIAALVLVHLVGPEAIPGAEIVSAANSRKQAALIFKACVEMIQFDAQAPEPLGLGELCTIIRSKSRIVCHHFGSFYQSLSADGDIEEGISPTVWIYDELGRTKKTVLYESLANATGAWAEPLGFIISVQARSPQLIMSKLVNFAIDQMAAWSRGDESEIDRSWSCKVYAVPEDADPFDQSLWHLANPGIEDEIDEDTGELLPAFKSLKTIQDAANEAKRLPSQMASFRNLQLNQQVDDLVAMLHLKEDWLACSRDFDERALRGRRCWGGLDLSRSIDLCGLGLVFEEIDGAKPVKVRIWTPEHRLAERAQRDGVKYQEWIDAGHLIKCPGTHVDYRFVAKEIARCRSQFDFREMAYDPWRMPELREALDEIGVPYWTKGEDAEDEAALCLVPFIQGPISFNPAIEAMEIDVLEHRLAHGGHPVLQWCASNAVTRSDHNGNRTLAKNKARARIDPYVAVTMANGLASRPAEAEQTVETWLLVI